MGGDFRPLWADGVRVHELVGLSGVILFEETVLLLREIHDITREGSSDVPGKDLQQFSLKCHPLNVVTKA